MEGMRDKEGRLVMHVEPNGNIIFGEAFKPEHMQKTKDNPAYPESIQIRQLKEYNLLN